MSITTDLQKRITASVRHRQLFTPDATLIVGLSGGADSVALINLLTTLPGYSLKLIAAHLNHCLRGIESDGDERFCRDLAVRGGITFESRRVDVAQLAAQKGLNLEDAGRQARMEFLDELAAAKGAVAVVLAHHADDQAETVLMRLLRGSGSHGLAGIAWKNRRGYVRPLLNVTRQEIEAYLREQSLEWREDSSNRDTGLLRNRLRHEIIPQLEGCNPSLREALTATAAIMADEDDLLESLTEAAFSEVCDCAEGQTGCSIARLTSQPPAIVRRLLRRMHATVSSGRGQLTHQHVESIIDMTGSPRPNQRLNLPGDLVAVREYDRLDLKTAGSQPDHSAIIRIDGPGVYPLPDGSTVRIEEVLPGVVITGSAVCAGFDLDRAPFPWTVRTFRPGDRMQPLGMAGHKKVKEIFIDSKIPASRRAVTPLFFSGGDLIWLAGIRTSHTARIDAGSTRIVRVEILPNDHR